MDQVYTLKSSADGKVMYVATKQECAMVDDRVRGAYLHRGTPILDIIYRDCQHALSLHFSEAAAAAEVFAKIQAFLLARIE